MDKEMVEYLIAMYKYYFDDNIVHDEEWEKNKPILKSKNENLINLDTEIQRNKEIIKEKTDKEDIKKTLKFLKEEIQRLESLL